MTAFHKVNMFVNLADILVNLNNFLISLTRDLMIDIKEPTDKLKSVVQIPRNVGLKESLNLFHFVHTSRKLNP